MQTLYIADLPLDGDPDDTWTGAHVIIDNWIRERLGLVLPADGRDVGNGELGTRGRSTLTIGADGSRLHTWQTRRADPAQPAWAFDVTAWLVLDRTQETPTTHLRVRLGAHALHHRITELPQPAGPPRFVGSILDQYDVRVDGRRLGHPTEVDATTGADLLTWLEDPDRTRPILVLSPANSTGRPLLDPSRLARQLGGLAHVAVLADRPATFALTAAFGSGDLSVYGGASRLYWPGLRRTDRRGLHPLWFADRIGSTGAPAFTAQLFLRLGRLSALANDVPALAARLRDEASRARRSETNEQIALISQQRDQALRQAQQATIELSKKDSAPGETNAADELWAELETALDELDETNLRNTELEEENQVFSERLQTALQNLDAITLATSTTHAAANDLDEGDADEPPSSVSDAVARAAAVTSRLVFLSEAVDSAAESQYPRPQQVFDDLLALEHVAQRWGADDLPGGFKKAFSATVGSAYRSDVSSTALHKYASDYERHYRGQRVKLGPHIARGVGAPATILRIYWYADAEHRVLVVGHIGCKLRDDSNP